jgi:phage host-nuclease inhibitor protein Gam
MTIEINDDQVLAWNEANAYPPEDEREPDPVLDEHGQEVQVGTPDDDLADYVPADGDRDPVLDDELAVQLALRALARELDEIGRLEHLADAEIDRISAWRAATTTGPRERARRLEASIEAWHARELQRDPHRRTVQFPAGRVQARKLPDRFDVADPEQFLAWAREHRPDLVRTRHEPDRAAMRRALIGSTPPPGRTEAMAFASVEEDADPVPGVVFLPGGIRHYVTAEPRTDGGLA